MTSYHMTHMNFVFATEELEYCYRVHVNPTHTTCPRASQVRKHPIHVHEQTTFVRQLSTIVREHPSQT